MSDVVIYLASCEVCRQWFAGTVDRAECPSCEEERAMPTTTVISIIERECLGCGTVETATTAPAGATRHRLLTYDCPRCLPVDTQLFVTNHGRVFRCIVVERFELVEQPAVTR